MSHQRKQRRLIPQLERQAIGTEYLFIRRLFEDTPIDSLVHPSFTLPEGTIRQNTQENNRS